MDREFEDSQKIIILYFDLIVEEPLKMKCSSILVSWGSGYQILFLEYGRQFQYKENQNQPKTAWRGYKYYASDADVRVKESNDKVTSQLKKCFT